MSDAEQTSDRAFSLEDRDSYPLQFFTASADSLKLFAMRANLPGVVSESSLELLIMSAYALAMPSPVWMDERLSSSTARGDTLFSLASNSNACVEVCEAFTGSPLLNGSTMSGYDSTLFSAKRYSLISTSTLGLTLFMKMLCLAMGSTFSDWLRLKPPGMVLAIQLWICPIICSMYFFASRRCWVVPQLGHVT